MPATDSDAVDGDPPPTGTWRRLVRNPDKEPLTERLKDAMLRPAVEAETKPARKGTPPEPTTVEELEEAVARCDDRERLIGLVAAPLAAAVGFLITSSLVANDPKAHLASGAINPRHVNPSDYTKVGLISLALALLMLASAWWRKRLYLGIASALFGITIFNLHFWGFGVPFLFLGAWYLVRAYRLHQKLKTARADGAGSRGGPGKANKRYTPPTGR